MYTIEELRVFVKETIQSHPQHAEEIRDIQQLAFDEIEQSR